MQLNNRKNFMKIDDYKMLDISKTFKMIFFSSMQLKNSFLPGILPHIAAQLDQLYLRLLFFLHK